MQGETDFQQTCEKITIDYDTVIFKLTTHSVKGLTSLDIELAKFIQETFNELFS